MPRRLLRVFGWFLLPLFLSGCELLEWKDRAFDALVDRIPPEMEASLGKQILPSILPAEAILRDPESVRRLEGLLKPLIESNSIKHQKITVYISREPALNAFAIPGGILIFNAGMLQAAGSPEEILGVAAHELAHVSERHVLKSMLQSLSLAAIVTYFLGDISELGAYILRQSQMLLQNGFTRKQEGEADRIGFDYLVTAGIDPQGMSRFFEKLQKEKAEGTDDRSLKKVNEFLSTHPLTEERIRLVKERRASLAPELKKRLRPVAFDLKSFQERIGQQL